MKWRIRSDERQTFRRRFRMLWGLIVVITCCNFAIMNYFIYDFRHKQTNTVSSPEKLRALLNSDVTVHHGPIPYHFRYDINQIPTCNNSIELLIFVFSSPYNERFRNAIRTSWASKSYSVEFNAKVLFLFGMDPHEGNNSVVESENERHHDVVRANFVDSYENLTLKSLAMLNWVLTYCPSTKYLLKSDDDVYVNIPVLLTKLGKFESSEQKFLIGRIQPVIPVPREDDIPKPKAKWIMSRKEYSEDLYPAYLIGSAYAMTRASVPDLYAASMEVHYIKMEDVFLTGLCANKAGIRRIHMDCLETIRSCKLRSQAFSKDSLSPRLIKILHFRIQYVPDHCKKA
ncbi:lactosylceramide 1,3-N-acetyl-beta-D-glucosaminyltransferase-like isoform X2 [Gigantopelta aegis]|uniref:lactosylceramide 1,3-N-acetyl-beta-D-glucosaminyltransferase-like isoform X2 n=1 Tax=Gigantopelta aegis TaxID=1735272 RepID=UPI001B88E255|nr:lactosylceramide 1,3-N-acetyl-beta-D-glucosaminyltransferase-like isoform X2 [Gigantopelta aegis]